MIQNLGVLLKPAKFLPVLILDYKDHPAEIALKLRGHLLLLTEKRLQPYF